MRVGRDGYFIIFIVILLLLGLYFVGAKTTGTAYGTAYGTTCTEGFDADPTSLQNAYVDRQQALFNPINTALIAAGTSGSLGTNTQEIFGTSTLAPGSSVATITDPYPLKSESGLFSAITKCEAVKTANPSAFDDPKFATDCGICLDIGTDSRKNPKTGGLVLLQRDRDYAISNTKGNRVPNYQATVGTCPAHRLASNKSEAIRIQAQMACEKGANFDITNCSQCYADGTYSVVDSNANRAPATLSIGGSGTATVNDGTTTTKVTLSSTASNVNIAVVESTHITISVAAAADGTPVELYGFVMGATQKGSFSIDLLRIVQADTLTGRRPRSIGTIALGGTTCSRMRAGFSQTAMSLVCIMPFTFVYQDSGEADMCPSGPFITKQASAEFLDSDPCYKKGSGPGKYNLECLQNAFLSNGCTSDGNAFPSSTAKAAALLVDGNGANRSINDISDFVYEQAVRSSTGSDGTGKKLSIPEWSSASVFCTGKAITSPCDTATKSTGPLSVDCLNYLWTNKGEGNPLGGTYSKISTASSIQNGTTTYCQSAGSFAPVKADGSVNANAVKVWQSITGGVEPVRRIMAMLHQYSNIDGIPEAIRGIFIKTCYGTDLAQRPLPKQVGGVCAYSCGTLARKVRVIGSTAQDNSLQISQLAVIDSNGNNVALGKATWASSLWPDANKDKPVDGSLMPRSHPNEYHSYFNTTLNRNETVGGNPATWQVDLGADYDIVRVTFYSRLDCCQARNKGIQVQLLNAGDAVLNKATLNTTPSDLIWSADFRNPSAPAECLACDTSSDPQVFWASKDNGYSHKAADAAAVCQDLGVQQATYAQLIAAQKKGADICASGWVSDYSKAVYPITGSIQQGCGNGSPGIKEWTPSSGMAGVWCYGLKPAGQTIQNDGAYASRKLVMGGGKTYYIKYFDATRYSLPAMAPGWSI